MKRYLIAHIIIEALGGIILYLYPHVLFLGGDYNQEYGPLIKIIALLTCFIAIIYGIVYHHLKGNERMLRLLFVSAMGYHMIICFYTYGLTQSGYLHHIGVSICHVLVFLTLLFGYLRHKID